LGGAASNPLFSTPLIGLGSAGGYDGGGPSPTLPRLPLPPSPLHLREIEGAGSRIGGPLLISSSWSCVCSMRSEARKGRLWVALAALAAALVASDPALPQPSSVVYVARIEGLIDLGLAPFVRRVLEEAARENARAVVFEINTFGGRLDAAVLIRDALLGARIPTVAFVNKRAISAGALVSLAAEKIAMAGGGTIGAATPVQAGQPGAPAQPVEEKTVSYVRKEFRATAESRNRPPLLAEAMVDADVEIPDVVAKGKLLTLTTEEALKHGLADFRAESLEAVLEQTGYAEAELRPVSPNWAENLVRFLTHPLVSSLLITVGMLGILIEIRTPGFGFPGALGLASLALFFWGHWLVELAGWEELLLVGAGLLLLALEILVFPGFGVAGAAGIAALLIGLAMSLLGTGATWEAVSDAAGRVVFSLLFALAGSLLALRFLPRLPFGRRLILETALAPGGAPTSRPESDRSWLGKQGEAVSPLRPSGIAVIDGERLDVITEGDFVDRGERVEVARVEGNRIIVRRARTAAERSE
jgi:membrane-bound serine protease (ClpP class)